MNSIKTLAFIPARSGSKGVPGKNIKCIGNIPLINYTAYCVSHLLQKEIVSDFLVSTDSQDYLEITSKFLPNQNYLRPSTLSTDSSPTIDAILHALDWFESMHSKSFDYVIILQPTSPFRTPTHVKESLDLIKSVPNSTCVASVSLLSDHHPLRIKSLCPSTYRLTDFLPELYEPEPSRRQDFLPPAYIRNGCIYITPVQLLRSDGLIRGSNVYGYQMPESNSINIDDHLDFLTATSALSYPAYSENLSYFQPLINSYS